MLCPSRTPNHLRTAFAQKQKRPHPSLGLKLLSSCVATTHPQSANSNSRPHKSNRPLATARSLLGRGTACCARCEHRITFALRSPRNKKRPASFAGAKAPLLLCRDNSSVIRQFH